jgi:hypothetical protein
MKLWVAITALVVAAIARAADPPSITSAVVKETGTGKVLTLDASQRKALAQELAALRDQTAGKGVLGKLAPDCRLELVYSDHTRKTLEIYGRVVLLDVATNESWQFYFGRTVLSWIAER